MLSSLTTMKHHIQDRIAIHQFINDAKSLEDFGFEFYDHYFEKNKLEMRRLFISVYDFSMLAQANQHAAIILIFSQPDLIKLYTQTDNDYATFLNSLPAIKILFGILKIPLPKLNFGTFIKLNIQIQSDLVSQKSELIIPLFTFVDDIIKFTLLHNKPHPTDNKHSLMIPLIEKYPDHIISLFKNCDDFIRLAQIDDQITRGESPAEMLARQHATKLMPLFKSANDIIKLARCKSSTTFFPTANSLIENNKTAILGLFKDDINLYKELKDANPFVCSQLVKFRDMAAMENRLANNNHTDHDSRFFATNKIHVPNNANSARENIQLTIHAVK